MMITSLLVFFLVYVYYRAKVVHLPLIYCRDNSRLHRYMRGPGYKDSLVIFFFYNKQSSEVPASAERGVFPDHLVLGVPPPVPGLNLRAEPPDQRHQVPEASLHLL